MHQSSTVEPTTNVRRDEQIGLAPKKQNTIRFFVHIFSVNETMDAGSEQGRLKGKALSVGKNMSGSFHCCHLSPLPCFFNRLLPQSRSKSRRQIMGAKERRRKKKLNCEKKGFFCLVPSFAF